MIREMATANREYATNRTYLNGLTQQIQVCSQEWLKESAQARLKRPG
jgi:hypothetical protein